MWSIVHVYVVPRLSPWTHLYIMFDLWPCKKLISWQVEGSNIYCNLCVGRTRLYMIIPYMNGQNPEWVMYCKNVRNEIAHVVYSFSCFQANLNKLEWVKSTVVENDSLLLLFHTCFSFPPSIPCSLSPPGGMVCVVCLSRGGVFLASGASHEELSTHSQSTDIGQRRYMYVHT